MIKKTALGLTLALTMSAAVACAPGNQQGMDGNQGTTNYRYNTYMDGGYRDGYTNGTGMFGTRNGLYGNRGVNNYNRDNVGMFGAGYDTGNYNMEDWNYNGGWGQGFGRNVGYNQGNGWGSGYSAGYGALGLYGNNGQQAGIYDEALSRNIEQRLNNLSGVTNSSVIVTDRAVIVGVDTNGTDGQGRDRNQNTGSVLNTGQNNLIQQIRNEVQGLANGQQVIIFTDRGFQGQVSPPMNQNNNNKVERQGKTNTGNVKTNRR